MRLLAHQTEIIEAARHSFITSVSAPRRNGKTIAALAAAVEFGGKTLVVSRGFPAANEAFEKALTLGTPVVAAQKSNLKVTRVGGSITCTAYGRSAGRGHVVDTLIFDDADTVEDFDTVLSSFYHCLLASDTPRIIALSIAPDRGLAAHLHDQADARLHWSGNDEATANPALGDLITERALERAKQVLPEHVYRREHLGIGD